MLSPMVTRCQVSACMQHETWGHERQCMFTVWCMHDADMLVVHAASLGSGKPARLCSSKHGMMCVALKMPICCFALCCLLPDMRDGRVP